jgi:hypothetical protein
MFLVFIVVIVIFVYFVIDSIRKLLDKTSYLKLCYHTEILMVSFFIEVGPRCKYFDTWYKDEVNANDQYC